MEGTLSSEKALVLPDEENTPETNTTDLRVREDRRTTKEKKKAMILALEKSLGVITVACKLVRIDRSAHYRWLSADNKYAAQVAEMAEIALDFAESKLHQLIQNNDTQATMFYLRTKGKPRGYIERQEVTGLNGDPLHPPAKQIIKLPGGQEITFE